MFSTATPQTVEIRDLIADILEIEPDDITETSLFKEDHGADSMRAIEILNSLERKYKIVISQEQLAEMVNLQAVCLIVEQAQAKTA